MQRFDCLSLSSSLFGPHLLEASAGTGKTFAIEHIYTRLILEAIEVEEILVVTFTRAATRELKARIRSNLEDVLSFLEEGIAKFEYLQPYLNSPESIHRLSDALSGFDRCQIFTIHGFCYRMLREFAFEANVGAVSDPDEAKMQDRLKEAALDFLENGIDDDLLCPEQIARLLKEFDSIDELVERLVKLDVPASAPSFSELFDQCKAALHQVGPLDAEKLLEDFRSLEKGYKVAIKGDFESQVKALGSLEKKESFRALLKEKGSLFKFLSPDNKKIKAVTPTLHYPGLFEKMGEAFLPLLGEKVFPVLQRFFHPIAEKIFEEEEGLNHDEMLLQMRRSIENPLFAAAVRKKYQTALIDEFQDTDAVQWEVFQKLFIQEPIRSLFLVGDPKQSIYRFRKADIYTYLKAKETLGEEHLYHLDTNFRSSKNLIGALNALFAREWLHLPKLKKSLPYHPVKAGSEVESNFSDQKGALHFVVGDEDTFLPFIAREIETLKLKNVAVLVKDRHQAANALSFLKTRGIAAVARSHTPIGKTTGFQAVRELFDAVLSPRDQSLIRVVMAGPFGKEEFSFPELKAILADQGVVAFARRVLLRVASPDILQVFEYLFAWEREEGFSFEGIKRFFSTYRHLGVEEGGRCRMEVEKEAVQVMTMHISKGLEFDVVFAWGLSSRTPDAEEAEELNAEEMRQLYVAMTRAKKRLYVPIIKEQRETDISKLSPMELFSRCFEGSFTEQIAFLSKTESITMEEIVSPLLLPPPIVPIKKEEEISLKTRAFSPSIITSFTNLAKTKEQEMRVVEQEEGVFTLQTMPRGTETGIIIHKIFELLFSPVKPAWKNREAINEIVGNQLQFSPLLPWSEAIHKMVFDVIQMPLGALGFSLADIEEAQPEMEFIFSMPPHFIKGVIDLVFSYQGRIYFLDWKSNWLENYEERSLRQAMQAHDYELQASIYAESLKRHSRELAFGGAVYLFIRGPAALSLSNFEGLVHDIQI